MASPSALYTFPSVRVSCAISLWVLASIAFWKPFTGMIALALRDERLSYTILIPFISACLIYLRRERIFREVRYCPGIGIPLLLLGSFLRYFAEHSVLPVAGNDRLTITIFAAVLVWIAGFLVCFGPAAFQAAVFPLTLLLLMVPLPAAVLEKIVFALQKGSAETADILFRTAGVPFVRHDFRFSLPGVDIEITEECSGIRSSMSLFITGLLVSHIFLQSTGRKICFSLLTIPVVIFKNALRIVTISWLGTYVNRDFFYGSLHRTGGLPFSLVALALMGLALFLLKDRLPSSKVAGRDAAS